jgi:hypothetical protein
MVNYKSILHSEGNFFIYVPIVFYAIPSVIKVDGAAYTNIGKSKYLLKIVSFVDNKIDSRTEYTVMPETTFVDVVIGGPTRFYLFSNGNVTFYRVHFIKDNLDCGSEEWKINQVTKRELERTIKEVWQGEDFILPSDFFDIINITPTVSYRIVENRIKIEGIIGTEYTIRYLRGLRKQLKDNKYMEYR